MRKMIYPPSIVWLFLGCAALAFCVLGWYIVCTDFIPLPPSPQLFDWIGLVILPIIIIVLLMTACGAIIILYFWCRPVSLTENELSRGFIFRKKIRKEDITGIGLPWYAAQRQRRQYIIIINMEYMSVSANMMNP